MHFYLLRSLEKCTRMDFEETICERGTLNLSNEHRCAPHRLKSSGESTALAICILGLKWQFSEARPDLQSLKMVGLKDPNCRVEKVAITNHENAMRLCSGSNPSAGYNREFFLSFCCFSAKDFGDCTWLGSNDQTSTILGACKSTFCACSANGRIRSNRYIRKSRLCCSGYPNTSIGNQTSGKPIRNR